ncbi:MAG: amino acid permease [Syntrophobacteraceae bacterium]|jgi:APA family basic amino acid/polyamine antiporter
MHNSAIDHVPTEDQRKPITLLSATLLVIANMIGTGVFTTLGLQLNSVHSIPAVLLLWIVGGASAFCGALAYGELGAMMPRSGGEYTYLSNIYHPAAGFLSGCASIVAGFGAPIALAAIALGHYMQAVFPEIHKTAVAVSAIALLTLIHMVDVRFGCQFQNVFTAGKILLIAVFIAAGFLTPHPQPIALWQKKEFGTIFSPAFAVGLVYVSYAYSGWNASVYVAGEIPKPERNLPISLFWCTLFVSVCYVLLNPIFLYTVPVRELTGRIDVAYLSAQTVFGGVGARIVTLLICLALVSTLSSMIMAGPRVTQAMGEDIGFLRVFAKKNRRGSPAYAILLQSSVALLLALTSAFDAILTYVGFTLALFAFMTVLGVFVIRVKKPAIKRPFKMWGYPVTPAFYLVLNGWMLCYLLIERPFSSAVGLLTVGAALLLYGLVEKEKNNPSS